MAAYAPHRDRTNALARKIALSKSDFTAERHVPEAEELIRRTKRKAVCSTDKISGTRSIGPTYLWTQPTRRDFGALSKGL